MAESSGSSVAQEDTLDKAGAPKKLKRKYRFKQEWRSHGMFPCKKGPTFAYCKTCNADVNIASGEAHGIKKHLSTSKHQEVARASSCSSTCSNSLPLKTKLHVLRFCLPVSLLSIT